MFPIDESLDDELATSLVLTAIGFGGLDDTPPPMFGTVAYALARDIHQAAQQGLAGQLAFGFEHGRRDERPKAIFKLQLRHVSPHREQQSKYHHAVRYSY